MNLIALVSSYREGMLVHGAIRSGRAAMGRVLVFDGPAGPPHERGDRSDFKPFEKDQRVIVKHGKWGSDAGKRTAMLNWCRRYEGPTWAVWIDGDEVLLWGEYLPDYCRKVMENVPPVIAYTIKIVEVDGTVADCGAKVIRVDLVQAVLESSYQLKLFGTDAVLSLPNQPAREAPIPGVPHLFHRSFLRPADRAADRLHQREPAWYAERAGATIGLDESVTYGEKTG